MKQEEVAHLASLARIKITDQEQAELVEDLEKIVAYVSVISDLAGGAEDDAPSFGALQNVFRSDQVTNEPDQYTEDLLAEMPHRDGRYLKVNKILKTDTE